MKKLFALCLLCAIAGCTKDKNASNPDNIGQPVTCAPVDYRNGVLYFPCVGSDFGNALSAYRGSHPNTRVEGLTTTESSDPNITINGHFVVVAQR
jgi:hypothetical protein